MVRMQEAPEVKVGMVEKRSRNKSIFTRENYQTRVLVVDALALRWFTGTIKDRGSERGCIDLVAVLSVEVVEDALLNGKHNVLQVVYRYSKDDMPTTLYLVTHSSNARDAWISTIRTEATKNDATLSGFYHKGVYVHKEGYNCCNSQEKASQGCTRSLYAPGAHRPNTPTNLSMASLGSGHHVRLSNLLVDDMWKRSRGKSTFFARINFKKRTFVLDANSLRYYDGDTRMKSNEKGRIHLSCVVTVEPVEINDDPSKCKAFQVGYYDEYDLLHLYVIANSKESKDTWVKTTKREAIKSGAEFLPCYHSSVWVKHRRCWQCCEDQNKYSEGCRRVIMQPDMKLCSAADLNASTTASHRAKSPPELKVGCMLKRSQNKGTFFTSNNYQQRVFTLDHQCLAFYTGYLEDRGELKAAIPLVDMWSVETVQDGMLEDKKNVFQVLYFEGDDLYNLYIVAGNDQERNSWVAAIKKEAARINVFLQPRYHPGVWLKSTRKYNCCGRAPRDSPGCTDVCGMSLVSVRDRLNTMDSCKGIRHRLGTLDSVPEQNESPNNLRPPTITGRPNPNPTEGHQSNSNTTTKPPCPPSNGHETTTDKPPTGNQTNDDVNKPQKGDDHKEIKTNTRETTPPKSASLQNSDWSRGITDIATSTTGMRPSGSGYQLHRNRSNVYSSDASRGSSRQPSFMSHSQYSEDFESVSEIEV